MRCSVTKILGDDSKTSKIINSKSITEKYKVGNSNVELFKDTSRQRDRERHREPSRDRETDRERQRERGRNIKKFRETDRYKEKK